MTFPKSLTMLAALASCVIWAMAKETHTVSFDNRCASGTPILIADGELLSTGGTVSFDKPLRSAIAYLQTGNCTVDGGGCTVVETTLMNTGIFRDGSNTDISLIPPYAFSVATGFSYSNGCDGAGANCTTPDCQMALHNPGDTSAIVSCQADNVNLAITFC